MSPEGLNRTTAKKVRSQARVLAALGDETRLLIVTRLAAGRSCSISHLTSGTRLTRQAVTKHLRVLESARIVRGRRAGRESLFAFNPERIKEMQAYLAFISEQWDHALARLQSFVER